MHKLSILDCQLTLLLVLALDDKMMGLFLFPKGSGGRVSTAAWAAAGSKALHGVVVVHSDW